MEVDFGGAVRSGMKYAQMMMAVLSYLVRPLSLTTQFLFKKDWGERYFAHWHGCVAMILITLAGYVCMRDARPTVFTSTNIYGQTYSYDKDPVLSSKLVYGVAGGWLVLFLIAWGIHQRRIRRRYATGDVWHSRCSGVPVFEGLKDWVRYVATAALAFGAFKLRLEPVMALIVVSLLVTIVTDEAERRAFHNMILDTIDAEIEAKHLAEAVANRKRPQDVEGMNAALPAYVSNTYRTRAGEAIRSQSSVPAVIVEAKPPVQTPAGG